MLLQIDAKLKCRLLNELFTSFRFTHEHLSRNELFEKVKKDPSITSAYFCPGLVKIPKKVFYTLLVRGYSALRISTDHPYPCCYSLEILARAQYAKSGEGICIKKEKPEPPQEIAPNKKFSETSFFNYFSNKQFVTTRREGNVYFKIYLTPACTTFNEKNGSVLFHSHPIFKPEDCGAKLDIRPSSDDLCKTPGIYGVIAIELIDFAEFVLAQHKSSDTTYCEYGQIKGNFIPPEKIYALAKTYAKKVTNDMDPYFKTHEFPILMWKVINKPTLHRYLGMSAGPENVKFFEKYEIQ